MAKKNLGQQFLMLAIESGRIKQMNPLALPK